MDALSGASKAWIVGLVVALAIPAVYLGAEQVGAPMGLTASEPSTQTVDREIVVNITAVACPPGYDNQADDDVCLAYDGQIPGPSFVIQQGQRVNLTLNHRVASTIPALDAPPELAANLTQARYTLHRHGISVAACEDGVAQPRGTQICDSTVGPNGSEAPNGSITYTFETPFDAPWHYHDHALGLDAGTVEDNVAGPMAEHRGLFGSLLVLPPGERTDRVLDLHLLDTGPNGGLGLNATVQAGERFDLIASGLGDLPWTVWLTDPDGEEIWRSELGPGLSRSATVDAAEPGTYTWKARTVFKPGQTFTGTIEVTSP